MIMLRHFALVALIASSTCVGGAARAGDTKIYPGSFCQPGSNRDEVTYSFLGMMNTSRETQTWTCPIVRDIVLPLVTPTPPTPLAITSAHIVVGGKESSCFLETRTMTGDAGTHDDPTSVVPLAGVDRQLKFEGSIEGPIFGIYIFVCRIAPSEVVKSYQVIEASPNNEQ